MSAIGPSLGDVNVVCTDLEASLRFYRDALGLEEVGRDGGAVRLALGSAGLLLLPFAHRPRPEREYETEAAISSDVLVDDLDETVRRLESAGGERIRLLGEGAGWAVRDPDGNVIEMIRRERPD